MQTKNNSKASNGDIGFIRKIAHDKNNEIKVTIEFSENRSVEYNLDDMSNIELAYAATIHKAQGSEFDIVILPVIRSHAIMLRRNLIYTAITRAKSRVILVGQKGMLFMAIHKNDTGQRNTMLGERKYRNEQVNKGASKVYMLARKCGLQFRRLTWNPNYKGFDDWQLSLKRSQSCKEHKMNFKRRFIYGLCEFETIHDEIKAWHNAKAQNESPEEYLGFTSEEFESYMKKDEESFIHYLLSFQKQQKFRIYQLDFSDGKTKPFAFEGLQALQKAGFEQPPTSEYALICEDTLLCCTDDSEEICLKLIFNRYNDNLPKGYCGRSIAPSDIVELYDEREKKYFYRDENLFYPVKFSPTQIKT